MRRRCNRSERHLIRKRDEKVPLFSPRPEEQNPMIAKTIPFLSPTLTEMLPLSSAL